MNRVEWMAFLIVLAVVVLGLAGAVGWLISAWCASS